MARFIVVNLFSWRATNPVTSGRAPDGVGDLLAVVVAAWGHHGTLLGRERQVLDTIPGLMCVGLTAEDHPRHQLYMPAAQPLVPLHRPRPPTDWGEGSSLVEPESAGPCQAGHGAMTVTGPSPRVR